MILYVLLKNHKAMVNLRFEIKPDQDYRNKLIVVRPNFKNTYCFDMQYVV